MKLKAFSGYTNQIEEQFNAFMVDNPSIQILKILADDARLYIFYSEG